MKKVLLLTVSFLLSNISFAQSQTDSTFYRTSVGFNIEAGELTATTELTLPVSVLTNNQAQLFLNKGFDIEKISGESLKDYSVNSSKKVPPWNEVTLFFEPAPKHIK